MTPSLTGGIFLQARRWNVGSTQGGPQGVPCLRPQACSALCVLQPLEVTACMWMLPSAYAGSEEYPWGLPVLWLHFPGCWGWVQASGVTMQDTCTTLSTPCPHSSHRVGGACPSSPMSSWDCSEELKGCSKGLRFLSLFSSYVEKAG